MNPIDIIPQINSLKKIIKKNIHLVSQNDMTVMKNFSSRFQHPWYNFYEELTDEEKERFDASRQFQLIEDEDWIKTVQSIKALSKFQKIETKKYDKQLLGKKKKQHEYGQLRALIEPLKCSAIADFGGGVGKLSFFLNDDLKIKSVVFDQDEKLLSIGKARAKKLHLNEVTFVKLQVDENLDCDQNLNKYDLGIGLHCCGNFGSDLLKLSVKNNMNSIMLFSCCYSKIINDDYRLSSQSLDIDLNLRALSSATLSFESIESGLYNFRLQILDFKYSFYHLLIQHHGISTFFPMSNSRKSMFNKSFYEFYQESMRKYCPETQVLSESKVSEFYASKENRRLINYFNCYYAFSRFIGQAIESYIILDRALYMQEHGYSISLYDVFNPKISPRNKCILASKPSS